MSNTFEMGALGFFAVLAIFSIGFSVFVPKDFSFSGVSITFGVGAYISHSKRQSL